MSAHGCNVFTLSVLTPQDVPVVLERMVWQSRSWPTATKISCERHHWVTHAIRRHTLIFFPGSLSSYDLKQELTKSPVSRCPAELTRHPAAQSRQTAAMRRQAADFD